MVVSIPASTNRAAQAPPITPPPMQAALLILVMMISSACLVSGLPLIRPVGIFSP
jgi:hypothetical protein